MVSDVTKTLNYELYTSNFSVLTTAFFKNCSWVILDFRLAIAHLL